MGPTTMIRALYANLKRPPRSVADGIAGTAHRPTRHAR